MTNNPAAVTDCDNCGADLYDGIVHDCDVTGSTVVATWTEEEEL